MDVVGQGELIWVRARTFDGPTACPGCNTGPVRVHGCQQRTVADIPIDARRVVVGVRVRRLVCPIRSCVHGVPVSRHTVLRVLLRLPEQPVPRVFCVDDFALRKRRSYATVLIDPQNRQRVEVADHEANTLEAWLRERPRRPGRVPGRFGRLCRGVVRRATRCRRW
ncbi:hypothetical protein GWI34_21580 [Actinomadura sp. DSM 109109]|nr:hypothetical protein [Actinomadura lepetitiana]